MVEIIEPHHGTAFDSACGSGGMFVQSAHFVEKRSRSKKADTRKNVSKRVTGFLAEYKVKNTPDFSPVIDSSKTLMGGFQKYEKIYSVDTIDKSNKEQIKLAQQVKTLFEALHQLLKTVDKEVRQ